MSARFDLNDCKLGACEMPSSCKYEDMCLAGFLQSCRPYLGTFMQDIDRMNRTYKRDCPAEPTLLGEWRDRVEKFFGVVLQDEVDEFVDILDEEPGLSDEHYLTMIADLLGDIIVFCASEMRKYGLPSHEVLRIIMQSNFSKLDEQGQPIIDEATGKFLKGPNFKAPEPAIREMLKNLRRKEKS